MSCFSGNSDGSEFDMVVNGDFGSVPQVQAARTDFEAKEPRLVSG
jgi:hypothetical protein